MTTGAAHFIFQNLAESLENERIQSIRYELTQNDSIKVIHSDTNKSVQREM